MFNLVKSVSNAADRLTVKPRRQSMTRDSARWTAPPKTCCPFRNGFSHWLRLTLTFLSAMSHPLIAQRFDVMPHPIEMIFSHRPVKTVITKVSPLEIILFPGAVSFDFPVSHAPPPRSVTRAGDSPALATMTFHGTSTFTSHHAGSNSRVTQFAQRSAAESRFLNTVAWEPHSIADFPQNTLCLWNILRSPRNITSLYCTFLHFATNSMLENVASINPHTHLQNPKHRRPSQPQVRILAPETSNPPSIAQKHWGTFDNIVHSLFSLSLILYT